MPMDYSCEGGEEYEKARLKTVEALSKLGSFLGSRYPTLAGYYVKTADDLIRPQPQQLTEADKKKPDYSFCPWCGSVFTADTSRLRLYAKQAPSSGKWANRLARAEINPNLAPNTRRRIEKLKKARNKTVITCLSCQKTVTVQGVLRMSREDKSSHLTVQEPELVTPGKKKKKKKRKKEENAGLYMGSMHSKQQNISTGSPSKETCDKTVPSELKPKTPKSTTTPSFPNKAVNISRKIAAETTSSRTFTHASGSRNPGKFCKEPVATTKKKKMSRVNHLQSLLAKEKNKSSSGSLSDFLKQV